MSPGNVPYDAIDGRTCCVATRDPITPQVDCVARASSITTAIGRPERMMSRSGRAGLSRERRTTSVAWAGSINRRRSSAKEWTVHPSEARRRGSTGTVVHTSPPPSRSGRRGWWSFSAVMLPPDAWILILAQLNPATRRGRVARRRVRPGGAASGLRPIGVKALATARRPVPCEFQGATRPDAMRSCPSNAITVDALSDASAVCGHASVPGDGCRSSVAARRRSRTAADRSAPPGVSFSFPDRKLRPSRGTTT